MTMSNVEMLNRLYYLQSISSKVTGKLAYAIFRNIRKIEYECQDFMRIKDELIIKYGDKNENGDIYVKEGTEPYSKFMAELKVYTDLQCDVDIYSIDEKELWESALNADEMLMIEFMVNENSDNNN